MGGIETLDFSDSFVAYDLKIYRYRQFNTEHMKICESSIQEEGHFGQRLFFR